MLTRVFRVIIVLFVLSSCTDDDSMLIKSKQESDNYKKIDSMIEFSREVKKNDKLCEKNILESKTSNSGKVRMVVKANKCKFSTEMFTNIYKVSFMFWYINRNTAI